MAKKPGLMKKYIQMAKRGGATAKTLFKKAWALQKRGAKGPAKKKSTPQKKGGSTVAAKKKPGQKIVYKYRNKPAAKAAPKRKTSQMVVFMRNKYVNAGANVIVTSGSAVAATIGVNKIPWIKDRKSWQKGAGQFVTGVVLSLFHKNLWWKKATLGAAGGGVITAILPWLSGFGFTPFSGPNRSLTPYQRSRLAAGANNGYTARTAGPVDHMTGPVDRMAGPWENSYNGPPTLPGGTFQSVQTPRGY